MKKEISIIKIFLLTHFEFLVPYGRTQFHIFNYIVKYYSSSNSLISSSDCNSVSASSSIVHNSFSSL